MTKEELKQRTKKFALIISKLFDELPGTLAGRTIGNKLLKSGTSVAANHWASCRAANQEVYMSKITIVKEESEHALFWLELLLEANLIKKERIQDLVEETIELISIFMAKGEIAKENNSKVEELMMEDLRN